MRILIAGAAGTLGSRVAPRLLAAGHEVWGTTRGRADELNAAGVRPVVVDLLDADATRAAVAAVAPDAIVQVLNALPPGGPMRQEDLLDTNRIRIDGTANLIAAAGDAGVRRYVAESFIFGYGMRPLGSPPVTEDEPLARGLPPGMQAAIDAIASLEAQVLGFGGIVLRCGIFYGRGVPSTEGMVAQLRARRMPRFGYRGVVPWVHIDDAAAAVVAAVESDVRARVYNVAGRAATFDEMIGELAASTGAPRPRRMPKVMARLAGPYVVMMLKSNLTVSTDRARAELGWRPSYESVREGVRDGALR